MANNWGRAHAASPCIEIKNGHEIRACLVLIHWVLFAAACVWRGHANSFHWVYEPLLLQVLWLADLPALAILFAFGIEINISLTSNSWWVLALAVIGISVQWVIIGIIISRILHKRKGSKNLD